MNGIKIFDHPKCDSFCAAFFYRDATRVDLHKAGFLEQRSPAVFDRPLPTNDPVELSREGEVIAMALPKGANDRMRVVTIAVRRSLLQI